MISAEYRTLNEKLHENPLYGIGGAEYADPITQLCDYLGTADILDYGCGKSTLGKQLGFAIQNYDPAIPALNIPPRPADIVVCTDVLEHVEPQHLDAVLADLGRLTRRGIFLAISIRPSTKTLADGRNAHLIQQPMEWWLPKLEKHFRMSRCWDAVSGFAYIGQSLKDRHNFPDLSGIGPPPTTKRVVMKSVFTDEQRCENIQSAMLRGLPTVQALPAHQNIMSLCAYGPSLTHYIDRVRRAGDVFTTSGAHRVLLERGIVPMGHLESDPRDHKAENFGPPDKRVSYFLASAASRKTFDKLHGFETFLFHLTSSNAETSLIARLDPRAFTIDGGTNSGMALIALGTTLGYRHFEIFGMDCSFEVDPELLRWPKNDPMPADFRKRVRFHGGAHLNDDQDIYRVWVGNRPFITSPQMMQSAQDFMLMSANSRCSFRIHGDGFLKNLRDHIQLKRAA